MLCKFVKLLIKITKNKKQQFPLTSKILGHNVLYRVKYRAMEHDFIDPEFKVYVFLYFQQVVIDAKGHLLGRLASTVAKSLLSGKCPLTAYNRSGLHAGLTIAFSKMTLNMRVYSIFTKSKE